MLGVGYLIIILSLQHRSKQRNRLNYPKSEGELSSLEVCSEESLEFSREFVGLLRLKSRFTRRKAVVG